jgi:hypothetical protein
MDVANEANHLGESIFDLVQADPSVDCFLISGSKFCAVSFVDAFLI